MAGNLAIGYNGGSQADGSWRDYMMREIGRVDHTPVQLIDSPMIRAVPQSLFDVRPHSYTPRVLNIGPLSPKQLEPSPIYSCKALCVQKFMARHGISDVEMLMTLLVPHPYVLSSIYSDLPMLYDFKTAQLLVAVDTVFLHEFLLYVRYGTGNTTGICGYLCTYFSSPNAMNEIWRDLFLMGNQIPLSFLRKIARFPSRPDFRPGDLERVVNFNIPRILLDRRLSTQAVNCLDFKHLLEWQYVLHTRSVDQASKQESHKYRSTKDGTYCSQLLNILWLCKKRPKESEAWKKKSYRVPSASQLCKVGIRFNACEGNASVIKYHKRKLQFDLPRLCIKDGTEDVLRNLLAYEQISTTSGEFCMYAIVMDSLINTQEDVAILTKADVIENHMGSDERLVEMWNDMSVNILERPCPGWTQLVDDVWEHYRSDWRVLYVEFLATYFSRPWRWVSVFVAFILLALTAIQTIYTWKSFYKN